MLRRLASLLLLAASFPARADEPARPLILISPAVSQTAAEAVTRDADTRGFDVAAPAPQPEPASEALIAEVRPLYQNMKFGDAVKKLEAGRESLIDDRLPSPGLLKALGEVEIWLGACLFLGRDKAAAVDHWTLAQKLAPGARPDRLFPPEVHKAFAARRPPVKPVGILVKLAPAGSRLWIDGRPASAPLQATPGLHYVVVERADQLPAAQIVRVTKSAPEIAVSLHDPAPPADALRQASQRSRSASLTREEGIGVSGSLKRSLWVVTERDEKLAATRYSSTDVTRPVDEVTAPPPGLLDELCRVERCPPPATAIVTPPTVLLPPPVQTPPPPPKKPVWKKGWFWGVLTVSVLAAAGAATGVAFGLTAPRDYDLHVR